MLFNSAIALTKRTYTKWSEHQAPRLGASVAFYSVLSFAPLLVLITAVIALVFGQTHAQSALIAEARQWIGDEGAKTTESLLKNAQKPSSGIAATVVAFITVLFGASGVFGELHDALNVIWEVPPTTDAGVLGLIKNKLFSFGMVLSVGFLLLVSLVLSTALSYIGRYFGALVPLPPEILEVINFLVSFGVITVLFGLMFKYVPNAKISWRDVGVGAVGTALLFTIGKFLLGLYLGKASVGSPYGAAGSLVAVVVWIYYSAQILFFGAEFTHAHAEAQGSPGASPDKSIAAKEVPKNAPDRASLAPAPPVSLAEPQTRENLQPENASQHVVVQEISRLREQDKSLGQLAAGTSAGAKPKPQLLMAVGLGFALGRAFDLVTGRLIKSAEQSSRPKKDSSDPG